DIRAERLAAKEPHPKEMDLDQETIFFDGLTTSGNDLATIDRLKELYTMRTPDDIDDCLSVHMGVNPHGQVVTTCNMTNKNEKFQDTPFFLGNFLQQPFESILKAEKESKVLQYIYSNPHPALHTLLSSDAEVGQHYQNGVAQRRYFGIIDYYIDLFRDERILSRLQQVLPEPKKDSVPAIA
ncbi:MAG: hypothetical protein AAFV29_19455, partial [Myxococcota bacterium]